MATWAEVVAEITFSVNKAAAAKQVEEAVAGARPVAQVKVDTAKAAGEVDKAVGEARPVAKVTVDTAGTAGEVDRAVDAAHPVANVRVNEAGMTQGVDSAVEAAHPEARVGVAAPGITEAVDTAVAESHPTAQVGVNEPKITGEVDEAVGRAHPEANVGVNEPHTAAQVTEAVEKAPPSTVPIDTVSTGHKVEEGLKSADTAAAGEEGATKYAGAFTGPVTALKGMVMGAVGAEAIMGGQQLFQTLITESGTAAKATKVVTEAIKTTGGAAGVTTEQVEKMAGAQARSTGVDKVAIEQSDALLMRYTNIRNAAGANNDVFNRTGQAALDMTAAMNKGQVTEAGLTNTTKLLGRALDEPAKAAGILRRSGVDLTDQQQKQIKTMVAQNDTLGAQKVVLDAVNSSYGGTAASTASGTAKMKAALTELEEELGKNLLPLFTKLISALTAVLDVLAPVAEWFNKGGTAAKIIEIAIVSLVGAMTLYIATVKTVEAATRAWAAIQAILDGELAVSPIGLVVVAIAALTIGIIELYKHSALFRDLLHDTWGFVRDVVIVTAHALVAALNPVKVAVAAVEAAWRALFTVMTALTKLDMALITAAIKIGLAAIVAVFKASAALLTGAWRAEWAIMTAVAKTFAAVVTAAFRVLLTTLAGIFRVGMDLIHGNWRQAWADMKSTVSGVTGEITGLLHQITGIWGSAMSQAAGAVRSAFAGAWHDMEGAARSGWSAIYNGPVKEMLSVFRGLPNMFSGIAHGIATAWKDIEHGIHDPIAWVVNNPVEGLIKVFNTVGGSVHLPRIPDVHMAAGGMRVTGGTTETADDVLVRVSKNETILSAAHSRFLAPVLAAVGVPGYAAGGLIGGLPGFAVGGLVHGVISGAGRALSDAEGAIANTAKDAAKAAASVYSDVADGVVRVASAAIDAAQIAADLAVSETQSLMSGMASIAAMTAPGAEGWTRDVTGAMVHQMAGATGGALTGIAGVAAKVLDSGGWLDPGFTLAYNGTGAREQVTPGMAAGGRAGLPAMAAGGLLTGIPNLAGGLTITTGDGASFQVPSLADLQKITAANGQANGQMASQLANIGRLLEQNPAAIANAIAQALNGVARLATAGAAYTTR